MRIIKRRNFIKSSAAAGAGLALLGLSPLSSCGVPHNSPYMKDIGLQLWTVRDQLTADPKATLTAIRKHGYEQVELMDMEQLTTYRPIIKDLGLKVYCSHIPSALFTDRWDLRNMEAPQGGMEALVESAQKEGIQHLIMAYLFKEERGTADGYKRLCDQMNKAGALCKEAGIQLSYHNHSFEFSPVDGEKGFDILMDRFDHNLAKFELDVFWASIAGVEPVGLMKQLPGRISLLHLKDKLADTPDIFDEGQVPAEAFKELGNGIVDITGVMAAAEKAGVQYCLVEQDQSPDPIKSIGTSLTYLNQLG